MDLYRGDIIIVNLSPVVGSEQGGERPGLVIQNDVGNKFSPTTIVAAVTAKIKKSKLPTHLEIKQGTFGLARDSYVLLEQVRTIDKKRISYKLGHADEDFMKKVDDAIKISFGLESL